MTKNLKQVLVEKVNKSTWWHVTPQDRHSYKKRGKFLASTYRQAEFYGRPNDIPEQVSISNPIYGFPEADILKQLFPNEYKDLILDEGEYHPDWYERRISLDAKMYQKAKKLGYDAIVLLGSTGESCLRKNIKPHSMELNLVAFQKCI